jgi:hypothetical protein
VANPSHAARWTLQDGSTVPLERLELHELVEAQQRLLRGSWPAESTPLLLAAIEHELARRWRSREPDADREPGEPTSNAA